MPWNEDNDSEMNDRENGPTRAPAQQQAAAT